jgi:hypothetical protein
LHFKRRTEEEHHVASHRHQQSPHSGGTGNTQSSQGTANDCTCHRAGDNTLRSFACINRMLPLREKNNPCWDDVQQQSEMLRRIRIRWQQKRWPRETPFERLAMLDCVTNNVVLNERRSPSNWRFLFAQDYLQAFFFSVESSSVSALVSTPTYYHVSHQRHTVLSNERQHLALLAHLAPTL